MAINSIAQYFFSCDSWFIGDWNPEPIKYERLRDGWFKGGHAKEDIEGLVAQFACLYTLPEGSRPADFFIAVDGDSISCHHLQSLAREAMAHFEGLQALRLISDAIKAVPEAGDNRRMSAGILFLIASSMMSSRDGMVIIGDDAGIPMAMTYELNPDNLRTVYSWGEVLAFSYSFNHLFWGFYPSTNMAWTGRPGSSFTQARKEVEAINRNAGIRQYWLEDIRERRAFTPPTLSEVVLDGFWGELLMAEEKDRLCFLLKSEGGVVPGIIDLATGSSNICLSNMLQFYSEEETHHTYEEDAMEEMEKARAAIDLLAVGAWRDIVTRETLDTFYDREREEKSERVKREKSNKTRTVKKAKVRYLPRRRYKSSSKGSSAKTVSAHYVTGFLRRLPEGHKASQRQIEVSREHGIRVPDGYTFVSPHVRGGMMDGGASVRVVCYSALGLLRK